MKKSKKAKTLLFSKYDWLQDKTIPIDDKIEHKKIRGNRGIESMYKNSYRAQLDMIALAATKANIMISLNGLLVSMLLVSGTYFLGSEVYF